MLAQTTTTKLNAKQLRDQITALLLAFPELNDDDVLRADTIEGETDLHEFVSAMLRKIGATQAIAHGTAEYIRELKDRVERLERREHAIRTLIQQILAAADLHKIELAEGTVSLRNGPPKVIITSESDLPVDFWRVRREPDKSKIGAALKASEFVPGAVLSNPEMTLTIRVR